jgi:hypothetical protein
VPTAASDDSRPVDSEQITDAIEGQEQAIRRIARSTLSAGLSPLLVGILADPFAPKVASLGAYRWVAAALAV